MLRYIFILFLIVTAQARPWVDDVIYFVLTDRFYDGDPENNVPPGCDPTLYDGMLKNINCYQGGDFRGLELALRSGYFKSLGITSIWITPPVKNAWRSGYDQGGWKTGYHGYWTQDFLDIDPHLTSVTSLDGKPYENSVNGRMQHYKDLVTLAHSQGIKIIQDVVCNHVGPLFYYDTNNNHQFDVNDKNEWVQPLKKNGYYSNTAWADVPKWNLEKAQPDGPRTILGKAIPTTGVLADFGYYSRKGFDWQSLGASDGQEIYCDFFSLRDLWTEKNSTTFDKIVNEFVEIYAFYIETIGVDGLRIDTIKHVHKEFWDAFSSRLRARLGDKAKDIILFGEVFDGNPSTAGKYTYQDKGKEPALDSVLNFRFCFTARDFLRKPNKEYGTAHQLESTMKELRGNDETGKPYFNPSKGIDGYNAQQKSITFIENHDSINRFRVKDVSEEKHLLAQAIVLLTEGIPCLYYGAEIALLDNDSKIGEDSETGRSMLFPRTAKNAVAEAKKLPSYNSMKELIRVRKSLPALRLGNTTPLWVDSNSTKSDDGIFAYSRSLPDNDKSLVIVVFNASEKTAQTGKVTIKNHANQTLLGKSVVGEKNETSVTIAADQTTTLSAPANSVMIYTLSEK